ncbi:MAG: aldo/keto reductase [Hyphomicrobiales bacterium]
MHHIDAGGAAIPAIGFGTWTLQGESAASLVAHAIASGYRHIDTAALYENEVEVGDGIRASGVPLDEIFVTTKVWYTDLADGDLQRSIEASLRRLGLERVDLALIHWPSKTIPLAQSVKALNEVRDRGLARHIGVSNFTVRHIEEAVALSAHPLVCNQIEYHPFLNQDRVIAACRRHGMAVVSYCPLCRGSDLLGGEPIAGLAEKYGRTPAQIVLRWHVQQNAVCIPRTKTPDRVAENFAIFDFELDDADMAAISALGARNMRLCDYEFSPQWD